MTKLAPFEPQRAPFNISIFKPTKETLVGVRPVTVSDVFDGMSRNFHEDGLFSVSTFGRVGSDERDKRFGYIDIRIPIFHPLIYQRLCALKNLYLQVLQGKAYAKWDSIIQDLIPARPDESEAGTGYGFFAENWEKIRFRETKSLQRKIKIELVEKYKKVALTDKILVLPAGLRDLEIDESGRQFENEINDPYRRLIAVSNTIPHGIDDPDAPYLDASRRSLQNGFNTIFEMINLLLYGKKGYIQSKWASRRIWNGTRNVISPMTTATAEFEGPRSPDINDTQVGLFQTLKGLLPVSIYLLSTGWLSRVFNGSESNAVLVNTKTLQPEYVTVDIETLDRWTTAEGLEKVIQGFKETGRRQKPVMVDGYYLGLVYSDEQYFRIFNDIDELPEGWDRKNVHPMTYTELMYLSGYQKWYDFFVFITRYPVAGIGSMYPSRVYCRTTVTASAKEELGPDWKPMGEAFIAREFPSTDPMAPFMDSLAPHPSNLKALGGDQTYILSA